MLTRIINWVKLHKSLTVLLLILGYFALSFVSRLFGVQPMPLALTRTMQGGGGMVEMAPAVSNYGADSFSSSFGSVASSFAPKQDYAPVSGVVNRMVIQNSYLSLLVDNVVDVRKKIIDYAVGSGGYMVSAETSNPQDAPTANITVRVPAEKLDTALEMFRSWGIKVVSENLIGNDVTDQYVDIDARITTLEKTKAAMEAILLRAEQISDLSNITQQVISIQSQIDALRGSQKSLEENSKLAKVTIYLSTDEIALPYAPSETFRPGVIFKLAVRSLVSHLRQFGSFAIWLAVYAVIWVPLLIIIYFLFKKFNKTPKNS